MQGERKNRVKGGNWKRETLNCGIEEKKKKEGKGGQKKRVNGRKK